MAGELLVNGFYLLANGRKMGGEWFGIFEVYGGEDFVGWACLK
jgi:hypothetical protein